MSKTFLLVTASPHEDSHSSAWGRRVLSTYGALSGGEEAELIVHDLAEIQPQPLTSGMIQVITGKVSYDDVDETTQQRLDIQQQLIEDLQSADHLIITTPVWHHFSPSSLIAWLHMVTKINPLLEKGPTRYYKTIDRLQSAIIILTTTVAGYRDGDMKGYDFLSRYLDATLEWMGIDDVTTIWHQGIDNLLVDQDTESEHTQSIINQRVEQIVASA